MPPQRKPDFDKAISRVPTNGGAMPRGGTFGEKKE